jgi:DNA uptake protein ComE-like DNA-binding protein
MSYDELKQYDGIGEKIATYIVTERSNGHFKDEKTLRDRLPIAPQGLSYEF